MSGKKRSDGTNLVKGASGRVVKAGKFLDAVGNYPNPGFADRVEGINTGHEVEDIPGRSRLQKAGEHYEAFRAAGSNVIARRYEIDQRRAAKAAKKGPDGISEAARRLGNDHAIQKEAWDSVMRGNPDLAKQLGPEGSKFRPRSPEEYQGIMDATGMDAYGRVRQTPQGAPGGRSGGRGVGPTSSLGPDQQRAFAEANQHFAQSHMDHAPAAQAGGDGVFEGGRGWANPATQAAAQAALGRKFKGTA